MTPELAAQARDFGVAALLEKPVSPTRLVEVVRTATTLDGRPPHPAAEPVTPSRAKRDSLAHRIAQVRQQLRLTKPPSRSGPG